MALFPSEEWLNVYVERINASPGLPGGGGDLGGRRRLRVRGRARQGRVRRDLGVARPLARRVPQGSSIRPVHRRRASKAKFIIRAPYTRWKEVIHKELDPVKGMMQGKLKLKGDLPTIVRYVKAANELVNLAGTVPTEFVDEQS